MTRHARVRIDLVSDKWDKTIITGIYKYSNCIKTLRIKHGSKLNNEDVEKINEFLHGSVKVDTSINHADDRYLNKQW